MTSAMLSVDNSIYNKLYAGFLGNLFAEAHSGQKLTKAAVPPEGPQGPLRAVK